MMDKERILGILSEMDSYLEDLEELMPENFAEYQGSVAKRRACERLLQISIECILDTSMLLVRGLRLGPPSDDEDAFTKLERKGVITKKLSESLKEMKRFRNVLVHRYVDIDDEKVYDALENHMEDFEEFKEAVIKVLN